MHFFYLALQGLNLIQVGHIFCFDEEHSGLVGRMLDSGSKGGEFQSHWRHSVTVSLSKPFYPLLSTCSIQYRQENCPDTTEK